LTCPSASLKLKVRGLVDLNRRSLRALIRLAPLLAAAIGTGAGEITARADDAAPAGVSVAPAQLKVSVKEKISRLEWTSKPRVIIPKNSNSKTPQYAAILAGRYLRPMWTLSVNNQIIHPDAKGKFVYQTPATDEDLTIPIIAIGPLGEIEKDKITIYFSKWKAQRASQPPPTKKRFFLTPGLSVTQITHLESNVSQYSSLALTGKISANYLIFPPRWDLGITTFATLMQFTKPSGVYFSDRDETVDVGIRYFGLNVRLGYVFPSVPEPWKLALYGGYYYTTMIVTPKVMGFENLGGPQLYPSIRRSFKKGNAVAAYAKYSPVSSNFALLNFSNREIAAGGAYIHPRKNGHSISISVDYSNIHFFLVDADDNPVTVNTTTLSLGVGYGF
jgi:hypothetical protein